MTASLRLKNRIALVTGASRGIGAAVAKAFAKEGAHVILVARALSGLEETDDAIRQNGGQSILVPMDLQEGIKIDELGSVIAGRFGRLDILVGNAAILGALSPLGHITPEEWNKVMAINVTANFRLIRSLDPLLRQSEAGRALFVTSGIVEGGEPYWGAYATSKAALEKMVYTYAEEVKHTALKVNLVDPGVVATQMRAEAMPGEDPATLPKPEEIAKHFVPLVEASYKQHAQRITVS